VRQVLSIRNLQAKEARAMILRYPCALLGVLALIPSVGAQPRVDLLGDPLPAGAVARLGTLRFKHLPVILPGRSLAETDRSMEGTALFAAEGKKMVSLDHTHGTIRLWDAANGRELPGPWSTAQDYFSAMVLSPDGRSLAAAGFNFGEGNIVNRMVVLWDIATAKPLRTLDLGKEGVDMLAFADEGKTLVAAGQQQVRQNVEVIVRWVDIDTGKELRRLTPLGPADPSGRTFYGYMLSPGAKYLAIRAKKASKRGQGLTVDSDEGTVLDLAGGKEPWSVRIVSGFMPFAFSGDGKRIAFATGPHRVELRDTATGKLVATPPPLSAQANGRTDVITAVAVSSDGNTVAISGKDSSITLWSPSEPAKLRRFTGRIAQPSSYSTQCLAFSPDNKTLLVGADSDLQLYSVATLKEVVPWDGHRDWVDYVAFANDGRRLWTGSAVLNQHPKEVVTWDVANWKRLSMTSNRTPRWQTIGIPSPEHTYYAGRGDDRFALYDFANGKQIARFQVPKNQNYAAQCYFAPGSKLFVLRGTDEQAKPIERVYQVPSAKLLCQLPAAAQNIDQSLRSLVFSADCTLAAVFGQDNALSLFEIAGGKLRHRLYQVQSPGNGDVGDFIFSNLAFSADGTLLASWTQMERAIRIWDTKTGKLLGRLLLNDQRQERVHLAWSPDGRTLAVGERTIQLWEVTSRKVRREFVGHAGEVRSLAFSPDGRLLASGSVDTTVLIWDVWGSLK
jgi:WD40 repeat protein